MIRWSELVHEEETHARRAQLFELAEAQIGVPSARRLGWWELRFTPSRLLPIGIALGALFVIPFSVRRLFFRKPDMLTEDGPSRQLEIVLALENRELLKDISLLDHIDLLNDWDVLRDWDETHG